MKKIYSIGILFIWFSSVYSQSCVPDAQYAGSPGIHPNSDENLPTGTIGSLYSTTITVVIPSGDTTINFPGVGVLNLTIDSYRLDSISLPIDFNSSCYPNNGVFPADSSGCIQISGIPQSNGVYHFILYLSLFGTHSLMGTINFSSMVIDYRMPVFSNPLQQANFCMTPNSNSVNLINMGNGCLFDLRWKDLYETGYYSTGQYNNGDTIEVRCFDEINGALNGEIGIVHNYHYPEICLVSGDPISGGVIITVDSLTMAGYDTAWVQRESAGVFSDIGYIVKTQDLTFIDSTADFSSQAFTYRLANHYCEDSYPHTSIHLQTNGRNLNWTNYVGLNNLTGFFIWRKNPGETDWTQIGTTSNISSTSYTDNSTSYQDSSEFIVEALRDAGCNTNVWKTSETVFSSGSVRSNKALSSLTGISELYLEKKIKIVNPSDGLNLNSEISVDITVSSMTTGQIINYAKNVSSINLDLPSGVYSVFVMSGNEKMVFKLVVIN